MLPLIIDVNREDQKIELPIPFSIEIALAKRHPRFQEFMDIIGNIPGYNIDKIVDFKFIECLEESRIRLLGDVGDEFAPIYIEDFFSFVDKNMHGVSSEDIKKSGVVEQFEKGELVIYRHDAKHFVLRRFAVEHKGAYYIESKENEQVLVLADEMYKIPLQKRKLIEKLLASEEDSDEFKFDIAVTKFF